jgi:hypothetical protein
MIRSLDDQGGWAYGQGVSVSLLEAEALDECLAELGGRGPRPAGPERKIAC